MRLFKKKSGLNPLDSASRRNVDSMANDGSASKPISAQRKPSFKVTGQEVQRMNVLGLEHCKQSNANNNVSGSNGSNGSNNYVYGSGSNRHNGSNGSNGSKKELTPKKKQGWLKKLKLRRKLKGSNMSNGGANAPGNITLISPTARSSGRDAKGNTLSNYFSMPTQGFECILDEKDLAAVNIENNTCQSAIIDQLPTAMADATQGCASAVSPLSNWESFVALLTSTNQTLITTIYDANDTIQSFLEEDDPAENPATKTTNQKAGAGQDASKQTNSVRTRHSELHKTTEKPVKEVSFNLSNSLPFDEIVNQQEETPDNTNFDQIQEDGGKPTQTLPGQSSMSAQSIHNNFDSAQLMAQEKENIAMPSHPHQSDEDQQVVNSTTPLVMPYEVPDLKAPLEEVFDSSFTLSFLRDVSTVGILLTYFKVPTEDDEKVDDIPSTFVNLSIKPGLSRGARLLEPRLYWSEVDGKNNTEEFSVSLLGIHSINTSLNEEDDDQTQFFTITTNEGEVHVFEAPTILERHNVVNGIRNVVAWLSYHLVMGNMATGTKLVSNLDEQQGEQSGELPSLKTPAQAMNDLSHSFLD